MLFASCVFPHFRAFATELHRGPAAGIALALALTLAGRAAAGGFAAGVTTSCTTASNPRAVLTGDLNGDGILDMVANSSSGAGVEVHLGTGNGAFSPGPGFPANPGGVPVLGDFNLDGNLDVVIPIASPISAVVVYNGAGDGSFEAAGSMGNVTAAEFLAAGDFNGDGKLDLASCGSTTTSNGFVRVFLNTTVVPGGLAQFSVNADVAVGAQPRGIAVGTNLFGTDRLDLVTANLSGSITLLKNDGTGHFGNRLDVATQKSCYAVGVHMLWQDDVPNQHSRPQIVTANRDSASATLLRYNPNTNAWGTRKYATAADPRSVSFGDTDGNLNPDVVIACFSSSVVSILSPRFDGTPDLLAPHVDVPAGGQPRSASVVNLDGDMKPDLLVAVSGPSQVNWIHGAPKVGWALGDTIPGFSARDQFGDTFSSSSLAGKWTFLDFCSNWCVPCRQYMGPTTQSVWLDWYRHPSVTFEYVTALIDGNTPGVASTRDDAIEWSKSYGIFRPVLHSGDLPGGGARAASMDAETFFTPTLRLIDPAGRVVWLGIGAVLDTTISRLVANANGVAIPSNQTPKIHEGEITVTYGAQQASSPYLEGADPEWMFPFFDISGFGENFVSNLGMVRHPDLSENWLLTFMFWDYAGWYGTLPTANDWQFTLKLHLDGERTLPPGTMATVVATDTFGVDHTLPTPVAVNWSNGTLTFGAIPHAQLAALPPLRLLSLSHSMQAVWVASVGDGPATTSLALRTPSPNPARSTSRLAWSQPRAGHARLDVFDVNGRHVRTVANGFRHAGAHAESWNLADAQGSRIGAGLYFLRLAVDGESAVTRRITVVR